MKTINNIEFGDWVKTLFQKTGRVVDQKGTGGSSRWKVLHSDGTFEYHNEYKLTLVAKDMTNSNSKTKCLSSYGVLTAVEAEERGWCYICRANGCGKRNEVNINNLGINDTLLIADKLWTVIAKGNKRIVVHTNGYPNLILLTN